MGGGGGGCRDSAQSRIHGDTHVLHYLKEAEIDSMHELPVVMAELVWDQHHI